MLSINKYEQGYDFFLNAQVYICFVITERSLSNMIETTCSRDHYVWEDFKILRDF